MVEKKTNLRAVKTGESAPPPSAPAKKPESKSVAQAAKNGSQRELLVAMRDRIAETVTRADCAARDLASLTKRLQDITHDIDAIDARDDADSAGRVRLLESALKDLAPEHPLLIGGEVDDDKYDASVI